MKLTLSTDRRLCKIEGEDFSLTLNGKTNSDYTKILAGLGVELVWVECVLADSDTGHPQGETT